MGLLGSLKIVKSDDSPIGFKSKVMDNKFYCEFKRFGLEYEITFGSEKNIPVERFKKLIPVGIVQNVIFEKFYFGYDNNDIYEKSFDTPILDSESKKNKPFYNDPVAFLNHPRVAGFWKNSKGSTPYRKIWYSSSGVGEDVDPFDRSGIKLKDSLSVDMVDCPRFGAKLRLKKDEAHISQAEHIITLQNWLVAFDNKTSYYLAHCNPVSIVSWAKISPNPELPFIGDPKYSAGSYVQKGIVRKINRRNSPSNSQLSGGIGRGSRPPVMVGETANSRNVQWLKKQDLWPDSG